jgi:hypothetical protein
VSSRRYDKYCPFYKSVDMLRNMITFYTAANDAVERTASGGSGSAGAEGGGRVTYNVIKARLGDLLYKLRYAWVPGWLCGGVWRWWWWFACACVAAVL